MERRKEGEKREGGFLDMQDSCIVLSGSTGNEEKTDTQAEML